MLIWKNSDQERRQVCKCNIFLGANCYFSLSTMWSALASGPAWTTTMAPWTSGFSEIQSTARATQQQIQESEGRVFLPSVTLLLWAEFPHWLSLLLSRLPPLRSLYFEIMLSVPSLWLFGLWIGTAFLLQILSYCATSVAPLHPAYNFWNGSFPDKLLFKWFKWERAVSF